MPQVKCPNGHRLQVSDKAIGQTISCPSCQASFVVEAGGAGGPPEGDFSNLGEEKRPALSGTGLGGKVLPGGFTVVSLINCFLGRPLLFFGLLFVVLGRGCDATSLRSVNRTNAQYNQARESFRLEWEGKLLKAQQEVDKKNREINDLFADGKFDPDTDKKRADLQKDLQTLNKALSKIRQDQTAAMSEKDVGDWKPLREASLKAYSNHQMTVYWYEWIFIFGTVVLVLGILILAFSGEGPERWVAYIMIAVLTFSIYVYGAAWLESYASSFDRPPSRPPIGEKF